jgi:hypothetical protein
MHGAIAILPNTPSWCGPQLKESTGTTLITLSNTGDKSIDLIFSIFILNQSTGCSYMAVTICIYFLYLGGSKGRDHWKDQGVGGRITLRWALSK